MTLHGIRSAALVVFAVSLLGACAREAPPDAAATDKVIPPVQRANPASTHCAEVGGRLVIEKGPIGEFGVCYFEDNHQCEEWALLRDECPVGGRRITGYATAAGRYCAITGGTYAVTSGSDASDEKGTCALPSGKVCEAEAWLQGTCSR